MRLNASGLVPLNRRIVLVLVGLAYLQGCAAVALTAGGLAAGVGINHTLSGIAYKTVVSPLPNVRLATLKTLNRMEINVIDENETEQGWQITADAADRDIKIELEQLTPTTTRMRVTANKENSFLKDSATATEIIAQTVQRLEQDESAQNTAVNHATFKQWRDEA